MRAISFFEPDFIDLFISCCKLIGLGMLFVALARCRYCYFVLLSFAPPEFPTNQQHVFLLGRCNCRSTHKSRFTGPAYCHEHRKQRYCSVCGSGGLSCSSVAWLWAHPTGACGCCVIGCCALNFNNFAAAYPRCTTTPL
jgi:hypothetical protein